MHSHTQEERERGGEKRERDATAAAKVKLNMLRLNPMVPYSKVSIVRSLSKQSPLFKVGRLFAS